MKDKHEKEGDYTGVKEAFNGLFFGVGMMIAAFLLAHFLFGMPLFQ
ncbi:hypothetical protein [Alkalicoccus halolimnae]|uniref:Uncharacterized protein n=1 Tax=Alkalicoccus halolimnae TaxID=1667239 RepID=A0AAJ8LW69_9BACI|nr:hypothetical protein [Alkalicoccus halolimnae]